MAKEKLNDRFIKAYKFLLDNKKVESEKDFCTKAKIPYKSVNHILNKSPNRNVQIDWIEPICRTFNLDRAWFFVDEPISDTPIEIKEMEPTSALDAPNLRTELETLKNLFIDLYAENAAHLREIAALRAQLEKKNNEDDRD